MSIKIRRRCPRSPVKAGSFGRVTVSALCVRPPSKATAFWAASSSLSASGPLRAINRPPGFTKGRQYSASTGREATARAVALTEGTGASIADTRKTLPGLRAMQKYAVVTGGGRNHRYNLSDGAMLKDNHIDAAGGIPQAVALIRQKLGHMVKLEVETRNLDEVEQALEAGADVIMLDNMDCAAMAAAVRLCAEKRPGAGRPLLEASGGITAETLRAVAETGVDIVSIGALTHSVTALDISMKIAK